MSQLNDSALPFSLLQFYATSPYACSYLPDHTARSQVATPTHLISSEVYGELVRAGFRRSGVFTYRPWCDDCRCCLPVRLITAELQANRSQQRAFKHHAGLQTRELPLIFDEEHYQLYNRYQLSRHSGGGMELDNHEQYASFLLQSRIDTRLIEFREDDKLRMVSIIDVLNDGLSSVYTFFDPEIAGASFGTFNVLWQVLQCQALNLPYLYLGYWIAESQKMSYKVNFQPLEALVEGKWQAIDKNAGSKGKP